MPAAPLDGRNQGMQLSRRPMLDRATGRALQATGATGATGARQVTATGFFHVTNNILPLFVPPTQITHQLNNVPV